MYRTIKLASRGGRRTPDAVALFLFDKRKTLPKGYGDFDKQSGGALAQALARDEFSAGAGRITTVYPEKGAKRVYICGLGEPDRFDANVLRTAAAQLVRTAFAAKVKQIDLDVLAGLEGKLDEERAAAAVADGLAIAGFDFDAFKGAATKNGNGKGIDLAVRVDDALRKGVDRGLIIGRGQQTARTLAATPPNVANPPYIVEHCRKLARETGLKCTIIDAKKAEQLKMGGLLAVGGGGSEDPALICLEWAGKGKGKSSKPQKPVMVVGKAVTFDTGGYSLKPSGSMTGMKYDKCGGMAVIGAMEAIARLKISTPVVALIPVAENMIDDDAYRVDDILTMANGVTVEITNTDAEGRLILADALAYGTKQYKPRAVIDLATLTGGVVVALGSFCAGMFCNDDGLRERLEQAADHTGERLWRLPLWHEHRAMMKSNHADLVNSGEREAHPIQGAAFLSYFVGEGAPSAMPDTPWAHLDIAGVADQKKDGGLYAKGPTGWGVRLVAQLLMDWS